MQTLDQAMADLIRKGIVSKEDAIMKSSNPRKLEELLLRFENRSMVH
jgi:twitching motility protein PilT